MKEPSTVVRSIVWSRLDGPGRDACSLKPTARGWLLDGVAEFSLEGRPARIHYAVHASSDFETLRASLRGLVRETDLRADRLVLPLFVSEQAAQPGVVSQEKGDVGIAFTTAGNGQQIMV